MNTQKVIELLGYSAKEAKVYLAALSLGEAHISDIAAKVKLPRTSVQVIADKLHKGGLMNFYIMRRYKYWVAESPERLLTTLKNHEELIHEAMPVLTALRTASWNKRKTKVPLRADWEPFRIIGDTARQAVMITSAKVEIIYVNNHWEKLFGYSLNEVAGENPRIVHSDKTPKDIYMTMWEALHNEKLFQSDAFIDKKRDGTPVPIRTTIFPVQHNGKLFYIQLLDDITEEKRLAALNSTLPPSV